MEIVSYTAAPQSDLIIHQTPKWLQYFSREAAVESVMAYVAGLPSSATEEKHTATVYMAGLKYFIKWAGEEMPTLDVMNRYVAHLLIERKLKTSTIGSKYLAAIRHYLKYLSAQECLDLSADDDRFMTKCQRQISRAAAVPTPKAQTTTNVPALWRAEFVRLIIPETNALLRHIDRSTLGAMRDYALMQVAFSTALRLAELARISLDSISMTDDKTSYILTVKGKRGNESPVTLPHYVHAYLMEYVNAFNAGLSEDDPRRIQGSVPVWQPLHRRKYYFAPGRHAAADGLSHQGIRDIIGNTSEAALGKSRRLSPHDTRRTAASIGYDNGMPLPDLQQLLRHKNASQTMEYVGIKPDYHKRDLSKYVVFG